jgi:6-phospho-beta-glucosidase
LKIQKAITQAGIWRFSLMVCLKGSNDKERTDYLEQHVIAMKRAIDSGVYLRGYYPWYTMDLYSWINGYKKRYGLIYVDYENDCKRIWRNSL